MTRVRRTRRRVALAIAALSLALAAHGDAAVHLVAPIDGALDTASAVAVTLTLDDPSEGAALVVRANGNDVTNRLRGDGLSRTLLLAGVPGHDNVLRLGRNTLTIVAPGGGQSTFSWRPRLKRVHLVVVGNRIDFAAYSSMATWRAEVDRISPWAFPDPARLHSRAELDTLRARCGSVAGAGETPQTLSLATRRGLLYDCATTLLPGGANADGYRESVVTPDVTMPVTP